MYKNIAGYLHTARQNVLRSVNAEMVNAYWLIGKDIVEEEQKGKKRAGYGDYLMSRFLIGLTKNLERGFVFLRLGNKVILYWLIPILEFAHAVRGEFDLP